jgi:alpha-tubulin suppressor-like RCC1 family protein
LLAGNVERWGLNDDGQLGNGNTTTSLTPVAVSGISNATAITAGELDACALLADGGVDCWGDNEAVNSATARLTGPSTCNNGPCSTTPVPVTGIGNATAIAVGDGYACALIAGGGVDCWGDNTDGALGDGLLNNGDGIPNGPEICKNDPCGTTPTPVVGVGSAIAITAGWSHACVLIAGGSVGCWGAS